MPKSICSLSDRKYSWTTRMTQWSILSRKKGIDLIDLIVRRLVRIVLEKEGTGAELPRGTF